MTETENRCRGDNFLLSEFISRATVAIKFRTKWLLVRGKSVRQADVSGGTHFPRKFCPTGQEILSASRIMCPGLGGKSVRPPGQCVQG